ncbi:hypothetical protein [Pseudoduganella sp. GCM10020061]|uniref:hypothetical protein n=1 Tax=Pseudoduganella sp. GCM10020061 TaxID=3317345 RepID=UPI003645BB98
MNDVHFGMGVTDLLALGYSEIPALYDEFSDARAFARDPDSTCYVKDDKVIHFTCHANCILNNINLIGCSEGELVRILGVPDKWDEPVLYDDGSVQVSAIYEQKGLVISFEQEKVTSISSVAPD